MPKTETDTCFFHRIARKAALAGIVAGVLIAPVTALGASRPSSAKSAVRPSIAWHTDVIKTTHGIAGDRDCRATVTDPNGIAAVTFSSPDHPEVTIDARQIGGNRTGTRQVYSCWIDARRAGATTVPVRAKAKSRHGDSISSTVVATPVETPGTKGATTALSAGIPASSAGKKPGKSDPTATPVRTPAPPAEITAPPQPPAELPTPPVETPQPSNGQLFSPTSFWNRQLSAEAALVPKSSTYVSELVRQVTQSGSWINTSEYSTPVYVVGPEQPTVKVTIAPENGSPVDPRQQASLNAVPIPANAVPARGTDRHMVVWQPSTNSMWEFWEMRNVNGSWTTDSAGAMNNVSTNVGYYNSESWAGAQTWWGATATSLPLLGGLIRVSEFESGNINHALALAIPDAASSYVWPAQRSDGRDSSSNAIPEGTTFRLPASLNIESLGLPPAAKAIALAAQKYGIIVRDGSADVTFYGEDPTPMSSNPYNALFSNQYPNTVLSKFPWSKLVAVSQSP